MKKTKELLILWVLGLGLFSQISAQTASTSDSLVALPAADRNVLFDISASGVATPIIWGLDTAWPSEENIRRGIAYMGADNVDIVRASFQPTYPLSDGDLQADQVYWLNLRLDLIDLTGADTKVMLNSDHPSVDDWYFGNAANWAQLMDVTTRRVQERGRTVVSIAPFNEPDYVWTGQGSIADFYNIAGELKNNSRFDNIRISGGNTLNCDEAFYWYDYLKDRLDEGNTHQLAGEFDGYASFFQAVRENGHHATNDELHNVMEAMVGVEYGMQTGIWWGTAEWARGEFVKASKGERLAYAEHRPNWTAASVYRHPEGKVQAFGGTSERQAATTTYRFISKDRDVYFDGYGPQREYQMELPGGTGYQEGQTNAERVVNITWGDDIQPVIDGTYVLVNRNSRLVMEVSGGSTAAAANVRQANYNASAKYQQWSVTPVNIRNNGDFSYFQIKAGHSGMMLDVNNWSLDNGGNIIVYPSGGGNNQQWFLEYAEDGWFYIRSRHSAKCVEVVNSNTSTNANIQQGEKTGAHNQQWRLIPSGAGIEFEAPQTPQGLTATPKAASVRLDWLANPESDLDGYTIFRAEAADGIYQTIARNIRATSFVDNTVAAGIPYIYAIKAADKSLNRSEYSNSVSAMATGEKDLLIHLPFEDNLADKTANLNHAALHGAPTYRSGQIGERALSLDGSTHFVQLSPVLPHHDKLTIAAWVYARSSSNTGQRIFDFGNDANEYLYLTPRGDSGNMRFAIRNGEEEQYLDAPAPLARSRWVHVAITLDTSGVSLYVDGEQVAESQAITITPRDFKPVLNYIGRSQSSHPLFYGYIDDFRIYNYALSAEEIAEVYGYSYNSVNEIETSVLDFPATVHIYTMNGSLVKTGILYQDESELDVSNLPAGIYLLRLSNNEKSQVKKLLIRK